ncbi:unnamed protein product [Xylocopa violacea]|uniref:PiggyBac transposable element-derived protein domain-containing protein n=1 Tax=Xylocopa violacea TaxID=135666 RepID=A0ABP1N2H2_XYLVO
MAKRIKPSAYLECSDVENDELYDSEGELLENQSDPHGSNDNSIIIESSDNEISDKAIEMRQATVITKTFLINVQELVCDCLPVLKMKMKVKYKISKLKLLQMELFGKKLKEEVLLEDYQTFSTVWNKFIESSQNCFKPGAYITVDEQLFPTKARCRFSQYMPNKSQKLGIKFWLVSDVETKYVTNGFPYLGKDEARDSSNPRSEFVVPKLVELYTMKGRTITTDNFFISFPLTLKLLSKNTTLLGTIRANKRELPKSCKQKKDSMVRFSTLLYESNGCTLTVYKSKPNKKSQRDATNWELSSEDESDYIQSETSDAEDSDEEAITNNENESVINVPRRRCRVLSSSDSDEETENVFQETETAADGTLWIKFTEGGIPGRSPSTCVFKGVKGPTGYAKRNIMADNLVSAFSLIINNYIIEHIKKCTEEEGRRILGRTMSRDKFKQILRFIRFDKRTERSRCLQTNKFALVSEIWDKFIENSQACYQPGQNITVDEQLFPTKARCKFIQYMPNKPNKFGIKFWLASDVSSKYILNGSVYLGKDEQRPSSMLLSEHVVLKLVEPYTNCGRNITTDTTSSLACHSRRNY